MYISRVFYVVINCFLIKNILNKGVLQSFDRAAAG